MFLYCLDDVLACAVVVFKSLCGVLTMIFICEIFLQLFVSLILIVGLIFKICNKLFYLGLVQKLFLFAFRDIHFFYFSVDKFFVFIAVKVAGNNIKSGNKII